MWERCDSSRWLAATAGSGERMPVLHVVVRGHVQGVGFRWFVRQRARELGVRGWVRNRSDGCVEVHAEGEASALQRLRASLAAGPSGARVTAVDDVPAPDAQSAELPHPFAILR
jgi:acylphosphatase